MRVLARLQVCSWPMHAQDGLSRYFCAALKGRISKLNRPPRLELWINIQDCPLQTSWRRQTAFAVRDPLGSKRGCSLRPATKRTLRQRVVLALPSVQAVYVFSRRRSDGTAEKVLSVPNYKPAGTVYWRWPLRRINLACKRACRKESGPAVEESRETQITALTPVVAKS